jgi:hypothetical protein
MGSAELLVRVRGTMSEPDWFRRGCGSFPQILQRAHARPGIVRRAAQSILFKRNATPERYHR